MLVDNRVSRQDTVSSAGRKMASGIHTFSAPPRTSHTRRDRQPLATHARSSAERQNFARPMLTGRGTRPPFPPSLDVPLLLTDENVHRDVTQWLRDRGLDVLDAVAAGLLGATDECSGDFEESGADTKS